MLALVTVLLFGCGGAAPSDSNTNTETDSGGVTCDTVTAGDDWHWSGECPQMNTPCDITVDGCELAIDYSADGGMTMGMPYAGTISGSTVTFADDNTVSGCVGEIEDEDTITGSCDDGCTFTLSR